MRRIHARIGAAIDRFFFSQITASGYGLMRIAWATTIFLWLLPHLPYVVLYYSDAGIFPPETTYLFQRPEYHFTLLTYVTDPAAVLALFLLLLLTLVLTAVGLWTRLMTTISAILLFTFQEHSFIMYAGGDTVLRVLGFYLMICPQLKAFSLDRALEHWEHWKKHNSLLPPLRMPRWPYALLLWQYVLIYTTAAWYKTLDPMWQNGMGLGISLHHSEFARFPKIVNDYFIALSRPGSYFTMIGQFSWILLLIPRRLRAHLAPRFFRWNLKRVLILWAVMFHLAILILMDAGSFSCAMMAGLLGLLIDEDFAALKRLFNRRFTGHVSVLFDGHCGLCRRSMFTLTLLDNLGRIRGVDYRDERSRLAIAPDLAFEDLDRAMHVRLPDGRTESGFDGVRLLARHLPVLWPLVPLLHLPGIAPIGRHVYSMVAGRRCSDGSCALHAAS